MNKLPHYIFGFINIVSYVMQKSQSLAGQTVDKSAEASEALSVIRNEISKIAGMNTDIASAAEEE